MEQAFGTSDFKIWLLAQTGHTKAHKPVMVIFVPSAFMIELGAVDGTYCIQPTWRDKW